VTDRPFSDPTSAPAEADLEAAFGEAWSFYRQLMAKVAAFGHAWNFSKSSGWMLKVFDRQKALFYLIPLQNGFKLSLAIREGERAALLQDAGLQNLHERLSAAKKYSEGYALQFEVKEYGDFGIVELLIPKLIKLRI
jgi:hypothetical protein